MEIASVGALLSAQAPDCIGAIGALLSAQAPDCIGAIGALLSAGLPRNDTGGLHVIASNARNNAT